MLSWPAAVVLYFHEDFGWILFVALILAPDRSFAAFKDTHLSRV